MFGDAVLPFGGRVWLGSLIRLLEPLGVSERLVRTSVYRLAREHWLRAEALGRRSDYLLTDFGRRRFEAAERHIYATGHAAWDGSWRMLVMLPAKWRAAEREHLRRSLAWQGFGQLNGNVYLHPSAPLEATLAALRALDTGGRNIILIMGGADKELDMKALLYEIPNFTKRVILLAGTGTSKVLEFLPGASVFDDFGKAVNEAFLAAEPGDTILFSPAFASFGMFKNEYDRGDQFDALVAAQ